MSHSRPTRRIARALAVSAAAMGLIAAAGPVLAQAKEGQPARRKPRAALIGLESQAKERRPGQVMPGDPAPTPEPDAASAPPPDVVATAPAAAPAVPAERAELRAAPPPPVARPAPNGAPRESGLAHAPAVRPARRSPDDARSEPAVVAVEPVGGAAAAVEVRALDVPSAGELVQWRDLSEGWSSPSNSDQKVGRLEIRAGLEGAASFVINNTVEVRVERLARLRVEQRESPEGSRLVIRLARGVIEVRPVNGVQVSDTEELAMIETPDRTVAVRSAVRLSVDAFTGTRQQMLR